MNFLVTSKNSLLGQEFAFSDYSFTKRVKTCFKTFLNFSMKEILTVFAKKLVKVFKIVKDLSELLKQTPHSNGQI